MALSTKVLIVDNHPLACAGLKAILDGKYGFEIIGTAHHGIEALQIATDQKPDIILMDVRMPFMDGIEACKKIRSSLPSVKIIMISVYDDDRDVFSSVEAGANGYLIKDFSPIELVNAMQAVLKGHSVFHPIIAKKLADKFCSLSKREKERFKMLGNLTRREAEILGYIGGGLSNGDIAALLFISEGTVKTHVSNMLKKLEKKDRFQLALYAYEKGLMDKKTSFIYQ